MADNPSRRLLQELRSGAQFHQVPSYATREVNAIHRDISMRYNEIQQVLSRQRAALRRLIQTSKEGVLPEDALAIVEYPHFALWVHICALQQLRRSLYIYKRERLQWINSLVLRNFATGTNISPDIASKLSPVELMIATKLQALVRRYGLAMVSVCSRVPAGSLENVIEGALAGSGVHFPDNLFCQRMGRLALLDNVPAVSQWTFEDPTLPTVQVASQPL